MYVWQSLTKPPNLIFLQWRFRAQLPNLITANISGYMVCSYSNYRGSDNYYTYVNNFICLHYSTECSKDFVEIYTRNRLTTWQREVFSEFVGVNIQTPEGRLCDERGITLIINSLSSDHMLVYIHTDDSGTGRRSAGLNVTFTGVGKSGATVKRHFCAC